MFTSGQLPPNFPRFQTRKALFILELQNDFLSVHGRLPVTTSSGFIESIKALVPVFRDSGDIIWVRSEFKEISTAADPPEIEELSNLVGDVVPRAVEEDVDHDLEEQEDEDEEESAAQTEDDSEDDDHLSYRRSASLTSEQDLISHRSSNYSQEPPHRTSTNVYAERPKPLVSESDKAASNDPHRTRLEFEQATMCCTPGTWGAEFIDDIRPRINEQTDRLIVKSCYSAFDDTKLLLSLRSRFVTEIYICGSRSHASVYATASDAVRHGFKITVVEDCLGYRDEGRHMEAMRQMADVMGVDGITSAELVEDITGTSFRHEDTESNKESHTGTAHIERSEKAINASSESVSRATASDVAIDGSVLSETVPRSNTSFAGLEANSKYESKLSKPPKAELPESTSSGLTQRCEGDDVPAKPKGSNNKVSSQVPSTERTTYRESDNRSSLKGASADFEDEPKTARGSRSRTQRVPQMRKPQQASSDTTEGNAQQMAPKITDMPLIASTAPKDTLGLDSASTESNATKPAVSTSSGVQVSQTLQSATHLGMLGPNDKIGEGDSKLVCDILSKSVADELVQHIRDEVQWQKMHHRTGEVPRLVAVQGDIETDGSIPVYRHPADESPPLRAFSPTVSKIKEVAVRLLRQPLNHVLIQLYRDGQDNISEHSDKTLDIVRGSNIVNVSLGAQRIMTLRTKKAARELGKALSTDGKPASELASRQSQRVALPHNSMFVLGQQTNTRWLHGVLPDKRPSTERTPAELAFSGQRISLTFRNIGTYLDPDSGRIWGQGARAKSKVKAGWVVNGETTETENMIRAFGKENQMSNFDWDAEYGRGFDVLNFVTRFPVPKLFISHDYASDLRVKLYLAEQGIAWQLGTANPKHIPSSSSDLSSFVSRQQPKFVDVDPLESEVEGDLAILLYLDKFYGHTGQDPSSLNLRAVSARVFTRVFQTETLRYHWHQVLQASHEEDTHLLTGELALWESRMDNGQYVSGDVSTVADCAFWPILQEIIEGWKGWSVERFPRLTEYHERTMRRDSVVRVLR
ncbi:hypothetical protein MMC16_004508 [Acarospora aff. strigata]|nr:hypothetical protein [Acarospora aff. strigata]